jgi:phosphoribosylaminoimidazole-succinocarboxamide synthase
VPEADVNVSRGIERHHQAFGFRSPADIDRYEALLKEGFNVISEALAAPGSGLRRHKFEFGYVTDAAGREAHLHG